MSFRSYRDYIDSMGLLNNNYGFNVDGELENPKGFWISTSNPKRIVEQSYTKGRVLVYNSGYTVISTKIVSSIL